MVLIENTPLLARLPFPSPTAQADRILVNSLFTARMFQKVFSNSRHKHLEIIYPGIQSKMYFEAGEEEALADDERIQIG